MLEFIENKGIVVKEWLYEILFLYSIL
jgi:hypothetical protein